ncbi:MAG: MarR family transcriptional regulator [Xanthomonadales bacterium]|nr:MarR family transcriptional regulator [Xanthomonadales bacterium]
MSINPMTARKSDNSARAIELLLFNVGTVYRTLRWQAGKHGIRWSAIMALKLLQGVGPLSQKDLADLEQVSPATMSVLVKDLLTAGLVARTPDPNDKRAVKISITAAGDKRLARDGAVLVDALRKLLEPMNATALADLVKGEEQLQEALHVAIAQKWDV